MGRKAKDLLDEKFGRLTAISPTEKRKNRRVVWRCACDCGNEVFVESSNLLNGHSQSCGCLQKEQASKINTVHGMRRTRIYNTWAHMIDRCDNPNNFNYHNYGGRGISVCDKWHSFENFYEDMGEQPEGLTLERIENDSNYEFSNCRWATWKEQAANTRRLKWFRAWHKDSMAQFMSNNQCEFARQHGLNQNCISRCLSGFQKQHKEWTFCPI